MTNKEQVKKKGKESLYFLAKYILGFKDISKATHGEIIQVLQSPSQRKLVCVPRGSLKSSISCVAFPIYLLLNNPNLRILIDSELHTNSATFLREIKAHMKSKYFLDLFGNLEGEVWTQSELIINKRTKRIKEASVSAGGIGTTKVGQHFDVIICDDLNSPNNSNSIDNANKVIDHYKYNISILEPDGTYVVIGTRYASNDVIGHILSTEEHDYEESA